MKIKKEQRFLYVYIAMIYMQLQAYISYFKTEFNNGIQYLLTKYFDLVLTDKSGGESVRYQQVHFKRKGNDTILSF